MKTLVTHINPHLDDIFAVWLFKKYNPDFKDAKLEFISADKGNQGLEETKDKIYIGVGRGRFDEHKEGLDSCAGSLVYEYLQVNRNIPQDEITKNALEKLVEWNKLIDTGKAPLHEFSEFSMQSFIRPLDSKRETSLKAIQLGEEILDRILAVLKRKQQSLKDWKKAVEFSSKFGKAYAVVSETVDRAFCKKIGGDLFLIYNPKYRSVQYFTPSDFDLESIYKKVKELDPEADWYLHQSHHIILCGSHTAPGSKPTKLTLDKLIEVAKSI